MKRHIFGMLVVLLFSFWTIRPLFSQGFFPMHDDTQVARVIVMGKALRQGQFPVRWVSDLGYGYGYPIFNFYGPLPYYVGGFVYSLGIDALISTKIMFALGILLAGISMYFFVESFAGIAAGILSSLLFMYAPYHAVQIYVRGAVGEFWALAFLPFALYGIVGILQKKRLAWIIGSIGLAGIIMSHTILGYVTVFFFFLFVLCFFLMSLRNKRHVINIVPFLLLVGVGLGLSAFFWLPAITEMKYTNVAAQIGPTANFRDHFVCPLQLWDSPWGFGGSVPGCMDGLSFRLGKVLIFLAIGSIGLWIFRRKKDFNMGMIMGVLISVISIFFMIPISQKIWEFLPFFPYIQYPWRFLTFAILGLSILGGIWITYWNKLQWLLLFAAIPIMLFVHGKLFVPQYTYPITSSFFENSTYLRFQASKISDEYLPKEVPHARNVSEIVKGIFPVQPELMSDIEIDTDAYVKVFLTAGHDMTVAINKAYFPGWIYLVNGKKIIPNIESGLPHIFIPSGTNVVELTFMNTPIRSAANMITVITIFLFLLYYGKKTLC